LGTNAAPKCFAVAASFMTPTIAIERFTRQKQTLSGSFRPGELPRLKDLLAAEEGEIHYELSGRLEQDAAGSQKRCVKCIISGWFFVVDGATLQPVRYQPELTVQLVVVASEAELPPLELETEDEDYIVCGNEMDVLARVEEEILLDLPGVSAGGAGGLALPRVAGKTAPKAAAPMDARAGEKTGAKISPFAKLAELKKK
jgi:uncharacterized protein